MMSLRQSVRTAVYVIRHREIPADVRERIADEIAEDDAFVDQLLDDLSNHLYARATSRAAQPHLTPVGGAL